MKQLQFEDYEEFSCDIADKFDSLEDEFGDVSIIAKYEEAKEIIRELLCLGYDVASIDIHDELWENYYDEYIISLNFDGVWCEKFKRDSGYFTDESNVIYIMDNCSSALIKNLCVNEIYEVGIDTDSIDTLCDECNDCESCRKCYDDDFYSINGKQVDKNTYDKYVSQFAPELVHNDKDTSSYCDYSISVKCGIDADEALEFITDIERRMSHINDMFREMNNFRRLFNW